jgi:hypothetical protein
MSSGLHPVVLFLPQESVDPKYIPDEEKEAFLMERHKE